MSVRVNFRFPDKLYVRLQAHLEKAPHLSATFIVTNALEDWLEEVEEQAKEVAAAPRPDEEVREKPPEDFKKLDWSEDGKIEIPPPRRREPKSCPDCGSGGVHFRGCKKVGAVR